MAKIIVVTSGKGGVGKTTSSAAIGTGLAMRGHRTVLVDFDVGLRDLSVYSHLAAAGWVDVGPVASTDCHYYYDYR